MSKTIIKQQLVSKNKINEQTIIKIKNIEIGPNQFTLIAGPCSVENFKQLNQTARKIKKLGINILRAGAFKPRTSPYSFQGMGIKGLKILKKVSTKLKMLTISEIIDANDLPAFKENIDILQVGARNMQNFHLLKEIGKSKMPVMLKRSPTSTIEEWLFAAEYILKEGNKNIILCERGIRTFETETRNTLCLASIPLIQKLTHLPILIDPSHGTGKKECISSMVLASIAAGANGVMIETHPNPSKALSDGNQSLNLTEFTKLINEIKPVINFFNKKL